MYIVVTVVTGSVPNRKVGDDANTGRLIFPRDSK